MSTPDVIYLIAGEDIEGYPEMMWCESSAPSDHCDPEEAVKYLRFDVHNSIIGQQAEYAKTGMDAANKDAIWREENAKRMLSQSNPTALESELAAIIKKLEVECKRLRNEADNAEGDDNAG